MQLVVKLMKGDHEKTLLRKSVKSEKTEPEHVCPHLLKK
jgi:hypothetical protein